VKAWPPQKRKAKGRRGILANPLREEKTEEKGERQKRNSGESHYGKRRQKRKAKDRRGIRANPTTGRKDRRERRKTEEEFWRIPLREEK
jgi:hypothetical protein